jgi:hypothetical protein
VNRWWLRAAFELLRDIAVTGTGLVIIWRQVLFSALHPSGLLLGTGLALTVPSVAAHVKALLPGSGGEPESSAPLEHPPPQRSSPPAQGG